AELRIERFERAQGYKFRNPRVAELADVRGRVPGERREKLFMGGAPRQVLHLDFHAGMRALEVGDERGDDLALATHGPEPDHSHVGGRCAAAGCEQRATDRDQASEREPRRARRGTDQRAVGTAEVTAVASQPPEKPARSRPRLRWALRFITRQTNPVRWFSIMAQMGP